MGRHISWRSLGDKAREVEEHCGSEHFGKDSDGIIWGQSYRTTPDGMWPGKSGIKMKALVRTHMELLGEQPHLWGGCRGAWKQTEYTIMWIAWLYGAIFHFFSFFPSPWKCIPRLHNSEIFTPLWSLLSSGKDRRDPNERFYCIKDCTGPKRQSFNKRWTCIFLALCILQSSPSPSLFTPCNSRHEIFTAPSNDSDRVMCECNSACCDEFYIMWALDARLNDTRATPWRGPGLAVASRAAARFNVTDARDAFCTPRRLQKSLVHLTQKGKHEMP